MSTSRSWNRCDHCNRFLPVADFLAGVAERILLPAYGATVDEYERALENSADTTCVGKKLGECKRLGRWKP